MSSTLTVVRTYLELRSPDDLRPAPIPGPHVQFVRRESIAVDHYRRLYQSVGHRWYWRDRDAWSDEQLAAHLAQPGIAVWEALLGDQSAGFFELARISDGSVEIAYFGLVEFAFGRGIGKAMLTRAAQEAWGWSASRVWLHTCTLDSPHALPNYLARGFREFKKETFEMRLPDD